MKISHLALAGAVLLSAASFTPVFAATPADRWIADSRAALQARVDGAGLADDGKSVAIRFKATGDHRRYAPTITRSSGSADYDLAIREALEGDKLAAPPVELNGRNVTFMLGQSPTGGASAGAD